MKNPLYRLKSLFLKSKSCKNSVVSKALLHNNKEEMVTTFIFTRKMATNQMEKVIFKLITSRATLAIQKY
jgi:hypothetical protein